MAEAAVRPLRAHAPRGEGGMQRSTPLQAVFCKLSCPRVLASKGVRQARGEREHPHAAGNDPAAPTNGTVRPKSTGQKARDSVDGLQLHEAETEKPRSKPPETGRPGEPRRPCRLVKIEKCARVFEKNKFEVE